MLAVADTSSQLASLVAGLATSSNEQDAGVEQIARAISQFEGTTQSIAANAEESAAAGTELSSQADALNQTGISGWRLGVLSYKKAIHG